MSALSIPQVADRLSISVRSVYRIVAARQIDVVNVGTGETPRIRITEAALAKYLSRREIKGKAA